MLMIQHLDQSNRRPSHSDPQVLLFWMELSSQIMGLYSWTILVNIMSHFSAWLTTDCAVDAPSLHGRLSWVIGTTRMVLELRTVVTCGSSTETEVRVWYAWTGGEVEWMESIIVWYLMQQVLTRPYTLGCTQQTLVRNKIGMVKIPITVF